MARRDVKIENRFDLEERTALFGEQAIRFAQEIPQNNVTRSLISQLVRAATSVGANYCEADAAFTKKDFRHKISICRKEAYETRHWLRMIIVAAPGTKETALSLRKEAKELLLIFSAILRAGAH